MSSETLSAALAVVEVLSILLIFIVGTGLLVVAVLFIVDVTQTKHAVRRNFPVVGRFRYLFEHMGEFFRQYFFALDREEMPFNRAERSWVYRAAKGVDNTVAFGSSRDLRPVGTTLFVNCPYPTLESDAAPTDEITVGPYCDKPYVTALKPTGLPVVVRMWWITSRRSSGLSISG